MKKENNISGIKSWPLDDRPREKLLKKGAGALSNSELLAILLRTGTKGTSAVDLSRNILKKFGTFRDMAHTDTRDWKEFKGLNDTKNNPTTTYLISTTTCNRISHILVNACDTR